MTAIIPIPAFVDNYIRLRITTAITSAAIAARWPVPVFGPARDDPGPEARRGPRLEKRVLNLSRIKEPPHGAALDALPFVSLPNGIPEVRRYHRLPGIGHLIQPLGHDARLSSR